MDKEERRKFVLKMEEEITQDLEDSKITAILNYSSDDDVYILKNVSIYYGKDLS